MNMTITKTVVVGGLAGIIGLGFSAVAFKYFPLPYVWIEVCWFAYWLFLSLWSPKYKVLFFNLAFIALLLGLLETYAWFSLTNTTSVKPVVDQSRYEGDYVDTQRYYALDDILGYAPLKNQSVGSQKYQGDTLVYDVTYTIDRNGLRIAPQVEEHDDAACVLFFGGSFTFGEGVKDSETLPYVVGELARAQVYNFGFHGYGPHQMLSALEHGLVEKLVRCQPTTAIYQAVPHHVDRVAGTVSWGLHSPKYVLTDDGGVKYAGHFDDSLISWQRIRRRQEIVLKKSFFYQKYFQHRHRVTTDKDIRLFLEIVGAARKDIEARFPGLHFHVILWDEGHQDDNFQKLQRGLEEKRIALHLISQILPDFHSNPERYKIGPADPHPNAKAHEFMAKYVVENIL